MEIIQVVVLGILEVGNIIMISGVLLTFLAGL